MLRVKKHDETRREYMTLAMEIRRQRREAEEEGAKKEKLHTILDMAKMQMPVDVIAKATRSTSEFVESVLR